MGLRLKYTGLRIVYLSGMYCSKDDGKLENESRGIDDILLLNKGMKDDRITVTGNDLCVST